MRSNDRLGFIIKGKRAFLLLPPACMVFYLTYFLAVVRYAHVNKADNLFNNHTKPVWNLLIPI